MSDEYIKRSDVLQSGPEFLNPNTEYRIGWNEAIFEFFDSVKVVPASDVAPVAHGRWISKPQQFKINDFMSASGYYPTCSLCGFFITGHRTKTTYCGGCGAKMDLEVATE